jgi:hypothetical protein
MKTLLLSLTALLAFSTFSPAADDPAEKRREIDRMLSLTGMEKMSEQIMGQMIGQFKTKMPTVPAKFWDAFMKKVNTKELIDQIIPVYEKYYTLEDLKAVNAFYASPAGKKVMATMPQITQESMKIGQAWGEKIAHQAIEEVQKLEK